MAFLCRGDTCVARIFLRYEEGDTSVAPANARVVYAQNRSAEPRHSANGLIGAPWADHHAFTLIELLVVIGIIAILLGILLPTIAKARASSQRVACRAHLHDIGNTFVMYLQDSHDHLPRVNPLPSFSPPINGFPYIIEVFLPYTKNVRKGFECPADHISSDLNRTDNATTTDPRYLGNGLNSGALTYYEREGTSYEYNTWLNAFSGGDTFHQALAEAREKMKIMQNSFRIFNDFEPFHAKKGTPGSTNFLFADWHVGDLE